MHNSKNIFLKVFAGVLCAVLLIASGITPTAYQTVQDEGSSLAQRNTLNFTGAGVACVDATTKTTCTIDGSSANQAIRNFGGTFDGGGVALVVGKTSYITVTFGCTIAAYNILVDAGTVSFDVWKVATGTAIPTVSNTIISGASYLAISTGTALHSTTTSSFTSTTVTANDIVGINLQATSGVATYAQLVLQCNAT